MEDYKLRIRKSIRKNDIYVLILIIMVVGSSWDALLRTSYLDEFSLICLLLFTMVFRLKIDVRLFVCLLIYSLTCFVGLLRGYGGFGDAINYIKCILMFVLLPFLGLTEHDKKKILNAFKYANAISVTVGIANYLCYNILHRSLVFESGNLKYIDGILVHRMAGFSSFSGVMATICLCLFILDLFKTNKKISDYLWIAFWFIGLYCTRGRFPFYVSICIIVFYFWRGLPQKWRRRVLPIVALICAIVGVTMISSFFEYIFVQFSRDFQNQIRWKAYLKVDDILNSGWLSIINIIFGVGCGYLGTVYESHFAITLIETGLIGLIAWYMPLLSYLLRLIKTSGQNEKNTVLIVILGFYLINIFINKSYDVPYLPIMCILMNGTFVRDENHEFLKAKQRRQKFSFRLRKTPIN